MAGEAPLFVTLTAMLFLGGSALAFWCVRAITAERQRKAFDPEATAELEGAVNALVGQLKQAADEAVARVARASQQLNRLAAAEHSAEALPAPEPAPAESPVQPEQGAGGEPPAERAAVLDTDYVARTAEVYRLADEQLDESAIAERTGLEPAEVRVLLSLRNLSQQGG